MKHKQINFLRPLVDKTGCLTRKALQMLVATGAVFMLSIQSSQAAILDRLQELGTDIESWVNVIVPTIMVGAIGFLIYYVVTSSPKWKAALGVFLLALLIWGGYDEIRAAAFKIGGGSGQLTAQPVGG